MDGPDYAWVLALQDTLSGATTSGHGVTRIESGMTRHDVLVELIQTVKGGTSVDFSSGVVTFFYLEPNGL